MAKKDKKSKIQVELSEAISFVPAEGQTAAAIRNTLVREASGLEDDGWEGLSDKAQAWVNDGIDALNDGDDVADFPDGETVVVDGDDDDKSREGGKQLSSKQRKSKKEAEKKSAGRKGKADEKGNGAKASGKKTSAGVRVKEIMLEKGMDTKTDDIIAQLEQEGLKYGKSTCDMVRSEFRAAVRVIDAAGRLRPAKD